MKSGDLSAQFPDDPPRRESVTAAPSKAPTPRPRGSHADPKKPLMAPPTISPTHEKGPYLIRNSTAAFVASYANLTT